MKYYENVDEDILKNILSDVIDLGVLVRGGTLVNQLPMAVGQEGIEVDLIKIGTSMTKQTCHNIYKRLMQK